MSKIILGIESSCDETSAAILKQDGDQITILANIVASSADLQAQYGGIIPEQAAREQLKSIIPVLEQTIINSQLTISDIDAIAVTQGPGLIGSLLVGVETAKILASVWQKPLIPVNHLIGHFYANWINPETELRAQSSIPSFPCLGLLVSGGHSDIVLFKNHGQFEYLGGTRDDAAGECFDKSARLLGLPYPGGPQISRLALTGNPKKYNLPRPLHDSDDLDFSFSGLKTAVANLIDSFKTSTSELPPPTISNLCASIEQAIIDTLVGKTLKALKKTNAKTLIIAGGVAANQKLTENLKLEIRNLKLKINLHVPPPILCTDNAAMITAAAFFLKPIDIPKNLQANPNLSLAY